MSRIDRLTINTNGRDPFIELLRFIFCFIIVNYHFYSHFVKDIDYPNFFCRGYIGDEFFFIVTGYFFAKTMLKDKNTNPVEASVNIFWLRLEKISLMYYCSWIFCFIGHEISNFVLKGNVSILSDLGNSIYELLFLEMFGFKKGLYVNVVGWFFSAYLIVLFFIGPWLSKYKTKYILYIAPLTMLISYGTLSVLYDYLYAPDYFIPKTVIHKGIIRALAGINAGIFSYGISERLRSNAKVSPLLFRISGLFLCFISLGYCVFPHESNFVEVSVQYDYIVTMILFIGMTALFASAPSSHVSSTVLRSKEIGNIAQRLGRFSFYAYFAQAIYYSFDKLVYKTAYPVLMKWLALNISVFLLTLMLMGIDRCVRSYGQQKVNFDRFR